MSLKVLQSTADPAKSEKLTERYAVFTGTVVSRVIDQVVVGICGLCVEIGEDLVVLDTYESVQERNMGGANGAGKLDVGITLVEMLDEEIQLGSAMLPDEEDVINES